MRPPDAGDNSRPLGEAEAEDLLRCICFKTGPPRTVGVELEWLVHEKHDPRRRVPDDRLTAAHESTRALPLTSAVTVEPGGQLELSSAPAASLMECVDAVSADLRAVRSLLDRDGLTLAGIGIDPWQPARRLLQDPRYEAMEAYLDRTSPCGRIMMCSSASIQVCLDAGEEEPGPLGHGRRWQLAHLLGAVLTAAFANSPTLEGRATGWRSTRQAIWAQLDPVRPIAPPLDREPRAAWTGHVLDAPVMVVRSADGPWERPQGLTFRRWIRSGAPRPPTRADLDYHLTTLFPPVRPRGHLELRMIDAQPGADGWQVPLAVTAALFDDPEAAERVYRTVKPLAERAGSRPAPRNPLWLDAARHGLSDPELHAAAVACFDAALEALPRAGASRGVSEAVAAFHERHVLPGRCPADDLAPPARGTSRGKEPRP
ncbi:MULTISPECIES: ergothioneine biosynthesis glutamate--cysteine ligase EgtA [Streptomyces]|uniref:Glutamate--cysteine ligase EgtA n=1 Tax=Streptomyces tsukubensis (strain DSM 42081 / NBRC 108919 / NRRL 18488 / 9993) TaxID=1114943 RepID=A0A7G3U9J8_STRT9|nr:MULTISPECIES: ergothioneine biosynthesis glutamate--cysteine ligase EgtA [Streptomyces]AZK97871.1 ergothioneine biosynthesis glutamate--cysteine ligase EgtA [Streptomyces tsukubensis]MYS67263.1 ergothioneine biosynthesis glutamate--cysteine ligase EgtA [Streptomyces sp. SID5473]QKM66201.1 ergothioneine biosynthesis glutamate--cysteine ligase EgtA [Streptomyces tsukubensis NRRL18488]TAI45460.1 ergothioneine biosynthesis glutamate--cysteine ligase EgtA [Streptomyces tsukubensis]